MKSYLMLFVLVVLVTLSPLLTITYIGGAVMEQRIVETEEDSLQSIASVVSRHIYDFYSSQETSSRFLVQTAPIKMLLSSSEDGSSVKKVGMWSQEVGQVLEANIKANQNVNSAMLIDRNGKVVVSSEEGDVGTMLNQTEMYQQIMEGKRKYTIPSVSENGSRSLNLTIPVTDQNGQILGMLQRQINFSKLNLYMNQVEIGKSGYIYVIGPDGMILYHGIVGRNTLPMGEFQSIDSLDNLMQEVASGELKRSFGVIRYTLYGEDITAAYKEIPELNWVVVAARNDREVLSPIIYIRMGAMVIALALGGIATGFTYRYLRRWRRQFVAVNAVFHDLLAFETEEIERDKHFEARSLQREHLKKLERVQIPELQEIVKYVRLTALELKHQKERVRFLEETDPLTLLYNRQGMIRVLEDRLHTNEQEAVIMIDLDGLRALNETYGFEFGDAVLVETGEHLRKYLGKSCAIARIKEDEFFIHYQGWFKGLEPERIAEQIRRDIENIKVVRDRKVSISASIGIYYPEADMEDQRQLFAKSEAAVLRAKDLGRNTLVVYSDELDEFDESDESDETEETAELGTHHDTHDIYGFHGQGDWPEAACV